MLTADEFNQRAVGKLPGAIGVVIKHVGVGEVRAELPITTITMAPNGYLHAGSIVTLADFACGCGATANRPEGSTGHTTIELKSNHLGTARDGTIECVATAAHMGRTTQVWDAVVKHRETGKTIALFRCTQMMLFPKGT